MGAEVVVDTSPLKKGEPENRGGSERWLGKESSVAGGGGRSEVTGGGVRGGWVGMRGGSTQQLGGHGT